jgi:large subunit ribosomal protein L23
MLCGRLSGAERGKNWNFRNIRMAIVSEHGVDLQPHQIVLRPLVTEKGTHVSTRHNAYAFEVHSLATKSDIKTAVEALWNVRVLAVRTQNRVGKPRRTKTVYVQLRPWKKAIVKLHEDDRISFF